MRNEDITFIANCEICGKKDVSCRGHHMIPQRLMNILPKKRVKQYNFWKLKVCDICNNHFHPENKLYEKIRILEKVIKCQLITNELVIL